MTKVSDPFVQALEALAVEETTLTARLDAVRAATGQLLKLRGDAGGGRPAPRPRRRQKRAPVKRAAPESIGAVDVEALQRVLKAGPKAPGELAAALKVEVPQLRYALGRLVESGIVVASGQTSNRRYALPGKPAKEEP
jgi:DNA-binding transcriptional ArsR family regulator